MAKAPVTARTGAGRWLAPIALSAAIVAWQFSFHSASPEPRRAWAMTASMGLSADARYFFYFFHHFGLFPVGALEVPQLGPSKRAAERFVALHGDRLTMDFDWPTSTPRFGDYGKLFLFYPDLLLHGDPANASAMPFNELLFVVALLAVFWAFWREGYGLLGTLIVVLVGSDPFQVLETYGRGNIFSIPISVALLAVAAHLRFLTGRRGVDAPAWAIAVASGVTLATLREVRAETALIGASVLATYLVVRAPLARRMLLAGAFVLAFAFTARAWGSYWADEFSHAATFVARAGGRAFRTPKGSHHALWHALYCGLGDYGSDRGYVWDDREAFRWATTRDPVTNPHPIPYHYKSGYFLEETWDGVHPIAPTDLPEYNRLVRARVVNDMRRHPGWYAGVLLRRALAIQGRATPASLALGPFALAVPGAGWLPLPVLAFVLWRRRAFHARIILFMLPLSATALLVYSGKGTTFYGIAHLVALAAAVDLLVRALRTGRGEVPAIVH